MSLKAIQVGDWYRADRPVLRDIDIAAHTGRVTVIVGPNGAGKSTLLRLLAGLRRPQSGRVELDGRALAAMNEAQRARQVAYSPQRSSLAFPFTTREAVAFGAYTSPPEVHAVEVALSDLDLLVVADEPVPTLSAGQQQRVALARAVAQAKSGGGPAGRVLLADEPVAGLDPRHAVRAMDVLRGAAAAGAVVVVVLHDLTLAARYADEAVVLGEGGRVVAFGPPAVALDVKVLTTVYGIAMRRMEGGVIVAER